MSFIHGMSRVDCVEVSSIVNVFSREYRLELLAENFNFVLQLCDEAH